MRAHTHWQDIDISAADFGVKVRKKRRNIGEEEEKKKTLLLIIKRVSITEEKKVKNFLPLFYAHVTRFVVDLPLHICISAYGVIH